MDDFKLYAETREKSRTSTDTINIFSDNFKMPLIVTDAIINIRKSEIENQQKNIRILKTCSQKNI
jgi:hypothetical protein